MIGDYYAICCIEDLTEVTPDTLDEANYIEAEEPDEPIGLRVWHSREEALRELIPEAVAMSLRNPGVPTSPSPIARKSLGLTDEEIAKYL